MRKYISVSVGFRGSRRRNCKLEAGFFLPIGVYIFCIPAQAKYGGGTGEPNDPYVIYTAEQMNQIGADSSGWDKHFKLMSDIDLGVFTGTEFHIVGRDVSNSFTGSFDGNGHTVSNFTYILRGATGNNIGLFGCVRGFMGRIIIKDLGLIDPNIDAATGDYIASLVGQLFDGTITDCYVKGGRVSGEDKVGGLVGSGDANGVTDSRWDYEASGQITSAGGQGRATLEMRQRSTFTTWDFTNIWDIAENQTYPFLRCHPLADLNYDHHVDLLDLAVLAEHWLEGLE